MKSYLLQTKQTLASETFHPSFCFRLDKDTSGIVIAAKTYTALQSLNEQIRERTTKKTYIAVVL
jgi:23S rRNA pseudouridine955/2504/2580 synthase